MGAHHSAHIYSFLHVSELIVTFTAKIVRQDGSPKALGLVSVHEFEKHDAATLSEF